MRTSKHEFVMRASIWPGFLVEEDRLHLNISDPVETGWVVTDRRWRWIGIKTWRLHKEMFR